MWGRNQKYGARKTEYNGVRFDSRGEAGLAQKIEIIARAGKIKSAERQVTFNLVGLRGNIICKHRVDFLITLLDGSKEVWEFKGFEPPEWKIKRKLFRDNYPDIPYLIDGNKNSDIHLSKVR